MQMEDETEFDSVFKEIECDFDLTPFSDVELQFNEEDYKIFNTLNPGDNSWVSLRPNFSISYCKSELDDVVSLTKFIINASQGHFVEVLEEYHLNATEEDNEITYQRLDNSEVTKLYEKEDDEITKVTETKTLRSTIHWVEENQDIVNDLEYLTQTEGPRFVQCTKKPDGTTIKSYYNYEKRCTLICTKYNNGMVVFSSRLEY